MMKYVCSQPDETYFHWQIEVMLTNFRKLGIDNAIVIFLYNEKISDESVRLSKLFTEVDFFWYKDEREIRIYSPTAKPYGMYLHYKNKKLTKDDVIFYHDSDIIFTEKIDFGPLLNDRINYLSDTISYIGYNYLMEKGEQQFYDICNFMNLDPEIVRDNQDRSGGAQYLLKDVDEQYWFNVYNDSISLYNYLTELETTWSPLYDNQNPLQRWCAEMWATLWNLWRENKETQVSPLLDFVFATSPIEEIYNKKILHNAGVMVSDSQLFLKSNYTTKPPFADDLDYVSKKHVSFLYVRAIKDVVKNRETT